MKWPVWVFVLCVVLPARADDIPTAVLHQAASAYEAGNYDESFSVLAHTPGLLGVVPLLDRPVQKARAQIFFDLARIHIARGDTAAARVVLGQVFALDPSTRRGVLPLERDQALDRTRYFLDRLRVQKRNHSLQQTSFLGAAGRSLILPGWGQIYRGHTRRGYGLMGTTAVLAAAWFVADRSYRSADDAYRATTLDDLGLPARTGTEADPRPFDERYEKVSSRAKAANLALGALAAVWAAGVLDHLIIGPASVGFEISIK